MGADAHYEKLDPKNHDRLYRAVEQLGLPAVCLSSALSRTSILRLLARQGCGMGTRMHAIAWLDREGLK
jgi:hypothetical protein